MSSSVVHPNLAGHSILPPCTIEISLLSLSVGIIFIAYALQVRFQPFLPPNNDLLDDKAALTSGMALVYVSGWL